jgi:enoyl-CoA hydratase/carnithine racemase
VTRGYSSNVAVAASPNILVRRNDAVARITLNRPEKRNALSRELMSDLIAALGEVASDPAVRVIVIEGSGAAFSAGHDLSEMVGREPAFYGELFETCTRMMEALHAVPQPVIAKVHGIATAAGCQLVAACDLAIAAEGTRFATPGVKIGLFCSTPMVPVTRAVGRKRAMELLLTGEPIDATTALEWGLINRVVPADRLEAALEELTGAITRSSPHTVATGKRAFYAQIDQSEHDAYAHCEVVMADNAGAADAQEGISAFLEKRPANWP